MQAIVLVGGEGTRLRPLTFGTPKPMVPIANVPFLARTMERLYEAGIRDVILPAGYMPQADHRLLRRRLEPRHEDHVRHRGNAARHRRRAEERRAAHHRPVLRPQRRHPHQPRPAGDAALTTKRRAASARCTSSGSKIRRPSAASSATQTAASPPSSRSRPKAKSRPTRSTPARICSNAKCST